MMPLLALAESPPAGAEPRAAAMIVPATDPGLRRALAGHPRAGLFTAPPWIETLGLTYGFPIRAVSATEGGRGAAFLFAEIPAGDPRLVRTGGGLWHGLALDRPEAELWAALDGSARRHIRHAQRCGVTVRVGASREAVHRFRALHTHRRKTKHRLLPQPAAFFDHLHERLAADDRLVVLEALQDGVVVAGVLALIWQDVLYYKFNASTDTEARPDDLLAWHTIRLGRERGLRRLDFGISDLDQPGLIRYERPFASAEREIAFWEPARPAPVDPRHAEATRTLHALTRLVTDPAVPDAITAAAGDQLYRFFP